MRDLNTDKIIQVKEKDYFRLIRMLAIHEFHILTLFRYTAGVKKFKFEEILKETCEDFGVSVKDIENTPFARFDK